MSNGGIFVFQTAHGVWAQELTSATCVAVNHRYRLIAFGAKRQVALGMHGRVSASGGKWVGGGG